MSKKSQILQSFKDGKSIEEIISLGFEGKYVKKIINQYKKQNDSKANLAEKEEIHEDVKDELKEDLGFEFDESVEQIQCEILNTSQKDLREVMEFLNKNTDKIKEINLNIILNGNNECEDYIKTEIDESYNPIEQIKNAGEEKVREYLSKLDIKELKEIMKKHTPDPKKIANKWRNKEKIINFIVEKSK